MHVTCDLGVKQKMYKTKLQELCHQRSWGLPNYCTMKHGPDHMPTFKASVSVNTVTFTSPATFTSSKEAQNQAAMLAFNAFSSVPKGSSTPTAECGIKEQTGAEKPRDVALPTDSSVIMNDMDRLNKSHQLQDYALRTNLDPPIFSSKTEGLPLATQVKATVTVDKQSFESPATFNSIEEAASEVALMSLSVDISEKGGSSPFKNKLQELTGRKCFGKPIYKTTQSGSPHMPTFFSSVEVESKEFHGKAAKSKKEAEQVAYLALKEYELKELDLEEISSANVKVSSNEQYNVSFPQPPEEDLISYKNLSYFDEEPVSNSSQVPSPFSQLDLSCLSTPESSMTTQTPKTSSSYLLSNRFKVYTCFPAFSEGITVLPIADNKWVAVSLDFPNERGL